ncbi:potassium-tellurite ethidium and proflavin transporter [Fusobacterium necrogenes]|uniref:Potassium-tellurite ethidium and proflavin transporter n=1 Tax=Fusobacterium necrogenes TaxID=858 RepID=A0A377GY45_9FUSO|nr:TDT family transporter [Fusobacterium necrogenes]STO31917.1 potassium-tellurite ethidium and proflavin transporter [Fusobacterium necrogenes]
MTFFKDILKSLPVALTGLALGISGISAVLSIILNPTFLYIGNFISIILLVPIIIKNLLHFEIFKEELKHPTLGSFIPTLDMALMNFSTILYNFSFLLGKLLWFLCILLHLIFAISFIYHRLKNWDIKHMLPSWFVPPIGIVVACVNSNSMGMPHLSHALFYIGFIFYIIMLPMMLYRIIFVERIDEARLPTFAIMAAPPNLCLAGYLVAFSNPNPIIINFLFPLGLFMTALIYIAMFKIFRLNFTPIYASFTFPLAISSTAILKYSNYIKKFDSTKGEIWYIFACIAAIIATIIITSIFIKMLIFLKKNIIKI